MPRFGVVVHEFMSLSCQSAALFVFRARGNETAVQPVTP